ncbi:Rne/Rng family ribonuclease [Aliifodinibius sp. S!AR15-10]|uniref:Rne/Rng family ribonuclease n=1 Tax=Aliifodinibius sp. S!AR15-10 TaxID=2950437 RepID=UPI00285E99C9|nr:Rne/Rng family ribonuclease [Aliifodinibius sp. S!AR15-10]MDR8390837.1 Rne/Rng family ribonuclease [Aliifodinibius sp. S!AR15-10]
MKNQIIIHAKGKQTRIALLEDGDLAQLFIESEENKRTVGNIYLAEVHKVMSGIRAAFIDMGTPKDAFLHFSDAGDHLKEYVQMLNGRNAIRKNVRDELSKINFDKISNYQKQTWAGRILNPGQRLLVQIVKEPIGSKGPRVSTDITIAGRFLVLIPMGEYIAVSRKINNYKERRRLKGIVGSMLPDGFGVIVRTVATGQDEKAIEDDMRNVLKKWEQILGRLEDAKPPALLYQDLNMTESLIRDLFAKQYDRVLIDDPEMYKDLKSYVSQIAPQMIPNVELYKGREHIFDFMKIAKDVDSIFSPRVRMPSGGYLIFEQTEAMYVVDVNSGPYAAKEKQEDNSLKTNLEAAREVAKQLRLRDIGGIIVVDFIDLKSGKNRKKIYDELKKEFKKDQAKTNVIGMSDFGLVQITRQRIRPSVVNSVSKVCPMCGGSGNVVTQNTIVADLDAWLSKFKSNTSYKSVDIYINPYLKAYLDKGWVSIRMKWMLKYFVKINLIAEESISLNEYKVTLAGSDIDITDAVMRDEPIDELVASSDARLHELDSGKPKRENLDYYDKDEDSSKRNGLPPRPGSQKAEQTRGDSKSKYYKSDS